MIRTLAALAALAAVPTIAAAQSASDDTGLTVLRQRPDSYSIIIQTAGKTPQAVRREISDAAYTACNRLPPSSNRADNTVTGMITCVNQARWDASVQYDRILAQRPTEVYAGYRKLKTKVANHTVVRHRHLVRTQTN
jgi:hypothetical protein